MAETTTVDNIENNSELSRHAKEASISNAFDNFPPTIFPDPEHTPETTSQETPIVPAQNDSTQVPPSIMHLEIDARKYQWWKLKDQVKITEVVRAIELNFKDDHTRSVTKVRYKTCVYKLETDNYEQ